VKAADARFAASILAEAWRMGSRVPELPADCRPKTIADGYQIQARFDTEVELPHGGWKIGCTSAAARKIMGARAPFASRVFATRIFESGVKLPASGYTTRGLEGEFAFRLKTALPPRKRAYTRVDVATAIGALYPALEIIDPRYDDFTKVGTPSVVADFAGTGALVLGQAVARWRTLDLTRLAVQVTVDGKVVGEGTGGDVMGDPLNAMVWLANWARTRDGLAAKDLIATGTCTGLAYAPPKSHAAADFGKHGTVRVEFT
jgi:2-keto-4-pentenoate hydratase